MAAADTIWYDIMVAAKDEIVDLGLAYFGPRVHVLGVPDPDLRPWPNVQLVTEGVIEEMLDGTGTIEEWRYPVAIWLCNKERPSIIPTKLGAYLADRKKIIKRFSRRRKPLASQPLVHHSWVLPELVVDRRLPQYQHVQSGLVLQFDALEE